MLILYTPTSVCIFSVLFSTQSQNVQFRGALNKECFFFKTIKSFFIWWSFPLPRVHNGWFWDEHCKEKLDTSHFKGVKGGTVLIQVSFTLPNLDCPTYSHSQLFVHHPSKPGIIEHSYTMLSTVSETKYYQI